MQNGISVSSGLALAGMLRVRFFQFLRVCPDPCPPAHASLRFRLARQSQPFSLGWWVSKMRVVSGRGGRPNGMVQSLLVNVCAGGLSVFR